MGKLPNGIHGHVSGKVGAVIGATWKGIPYVRSKPRQTEKREPTTRQKIQRGRIGCLSSFFSTVLALINITFEKDAIGKSQFNYAMEINKDAIKGEFPNFEVDYNKIILSKGELPNVMNPVVTIDANAKAIFSWDGGLRENGSAFNDQPILAIYCASRNEFIFSMNGERDQQNAVIDIKNFKGYTVYTWISFMSLDRKSVATGIYTGEFMIAE